MNINEIARLGSNVKPVIQNENCSVLMLNDATGEGVMTVYRVMPGVMIVWQKNKPPARQVEGVALASSKNLL